MMAEGLSVTETKPGNDGRKIKRNGDKAGDVGEKIKCNGNKTRECGTE